MNKSYFILQIKRLLRMLPAILAASILTCITVAIVLFAGLNKGKGDYTMTLKIGMVGDLSDYMGLNFEEQFTKLSKASNIDLEFKKYNENEAKEKLLSGELTTYLIIPDGFVEAVAMGRSDVVLKYVTLENNKGLTNIVMNEIAKGVSEIFSVAESSCFSLMELLIYNGDPDWQYKTDSYSIKQLTAFLTLMRLYKLDIIGVSGNVSLGGYYACSAIIIVILLFGFNACLYFTKREKTLYGCLYMKGMKTVNMVTAEYSAYVIILSAILFILIGICSLLRTNLPILNASFPFPEWDGRGVFDILIFISCIILALLLITSLQYLIFEVIESFINQVLSLFFITFFMGFISGILYPRNFFPIWMQKLGALLPTGVAFDILRGGFSGTIIPSSIALMLVYTTLFALVALFFRNRKIKC